MPPCANYTIDLAAERYGVCKCGFLKKEHGQSDGCKRVSAERAAFSAAAAAAPTAAAPPPGGLPAGWVEQRDASNNVFYANTQTGQTQWTRPVFEPPADEAVRLKSYEVPLRHAVGMR